MMTRAEIQEAIRATKIEMAALRTERAGVAERQEAYEQVLKHLEGISLALARAAGEVPLYSKAEIASMSRTKAVLAALKWRAGEKLHISKICRAIEELGCGRVTEGYAAMILSRFSRCGIVQRVAKGHYLYDPHKKHVPVEKKEMTIYFGDDYDDDFADFDEDFEDEDDDEDYDDDEDDEDDGDFW